MIRAGIIGYGKIGKKRATILEKHPDYELVSVCDISEEADYTDFKEMIDREELDCVFVCVPHTLTKDMVVYCIDKGIHVFAEKPPGINLKETKEMEEALKNNPICKLRFGFNHRYYKHIEKAREIINSEELGNILWMRGIYGKSRLESWRTSQKFGGRGILLSQGIHLIDLIIYLSGERFKEIKSFVSYLHKDWDENIEDNIFTIMKSENGIVASIHSSAVLWKNTFELHIGLEKGYIYIENLITSSRSFGFPEIIRIAKTSDTFFYGNPKEEVYRFGEDESWNKEIDDFADIIINDRKEYDCSIEDAKEVMKILEEIYNV